MKNTDLEIMPETPSQPARITRRSFVKRTGSTVIVTVLALHAFRNEARAAEAGGGSGSGPQIKLKKVSPSPELGTEGSVNDSSPISSSEVVKAYFMCSANYWKKVGEMRTSWSIKTEPAGTKKTNDTIDKVVNLNYGFTVDIKDGKLHCNDDGGTSHKTDGGLSTGTAINCTSSANGTTMTVKCSVMAVWSPSGSLTGFGIDLLGSGLTLQYSSGTAPQVEIDVTFEFELIP